VEAGEEESLGERFTALGAGASAPGAHLEHHGAGEPLAGESAAHFGARLTASPRNEMLIARGTAAVGQMQMGQPGAHPLSHRHGIDLGGGGM
jgi:hypothetical protein